MKKILLILPALFFILIFDTCKKPSPTANPFYFQCKINGKTYIPGMGNGLTSELLEDTTLLLGGNLGYQALAMWIINKTGIPVKDSIYILDNNPRYSAIYKNSTTTTDRYTTDSLHTGQLHITTLDKTNKIIQGTFYFKAYNAYRNDSVSVTDGKFRLHYTIS